MGQSQSATSIKIRIETKIMSMSKQMVILVSQQHPLKLGLKRSRYIR